MKVNAAVRIKLVFIINEIAGCSFIPAFLMVKICNKGFIYEVHG